MPRKKGKTISFDAMVKFFLQNYDIPTKKDVDRILRQLDRIEKKLSGAPAFSQSGRKTPLPNRREKTALETVLQVVRESANGIGLNEIKARTGFEDKKIRNIIFRLNKNGKIKRKSRGIYVAA